MKYRHLLVPITLLTFTSNALCNVEFFRDESTGKSFHSDIELSLDGESGNYKSKNLDSNIGLAWDDKSSHFMTMIEHNWQSDSEVIEKNNSFFHMRYTRTLEEGQGNNFEVFLQGKRDSFRNIDSRLMAGIGYRKTTFNEINERFNAFGLGGFYEKEKGHELNVDLESKDWRLNAYWHHKRPITATVFVNNVIYVQPSLGDFGNVRVSDEFRITNKVTDKAEIGFKINYSFNSEAYRSIKKTDFNYGTFISYKF